MYVGKTLFAQIMDFERYTQLGKKLHLRHLSPDCLELLDKAKGMIEVNVLEDPVYHPADDRLG